MCGVAAASDKLKCKQFLKATIFKILLCLNALYSRVSSMTPEELTYMPITRRTPKYHYNSVESVGTLISSRQSHLISRWSLILTCHVRILGTCIVI